MSKDRQGRIRRQSLNDSLKPLGQGGISIAGAKAMATGVNGTFCECTITGYYRTSIFEYPVRTPCPRPLPGPLPRLRAGPRTGTACARCG